MSSLLASPVLGGVIGGLGKGMMTGMAAKDAAKAEEKRFNQIRKSYDVSPDSLAPPYKMDTANRPTPGEKYQVNRMQYNPETGQIEEVARA